MRIPTALAILALAGPLAGCNTGAPQGVLPRDPVPPPPSVRSTVPKRADTTGSLTAAAPRRGLAVPDRIVTPRPTR